MTTHPSVDESRDRLHRAGWSVGEIATATAWVVGERHERGKRPRRARLDPGGGTVARGGEPFPPRTRFPRRRPNALDSARAARDRVGGMGCAPAHPIAGAAGPGESPQGAAGAGLTAGWPAAGPPG
jgi:hypothetical protein